MPTTKKKDLEVQIKVPILDVLILKDEDKYTAQCPKLDLVTEMDTPEQAFDAILEMIKEYAEDYIKRLAIFRNSPNRSHHYPYIRQITQCKTDWELRELIEVRHGGIYLR